MIRTLIARTLAATAATGIALVVLGGVADAATQPATGASTAVLAGGTSDPWDAPGADSDPWDAPAASDPWDAPATASDPWDAPGHDSDPWD